MVGKLTNDGIISGSFAPVLMNQSHPTYGASRNDLLARVLNARGKGQYIFDGYSAGEAADWGNELEPTIIKKAAERLGIKDYKDDVDVTYEYHDLFSVSLDGILYNKKMNITGSNNIFIMNKQNDATLKGNGIIESKLTSAMFTESPPPYRGPWQLQMQMMCYGASWGVIATLYQGTRLVLNVYEEDKDMQKQLIDAAKDFYSRLDGPDWYPAMDRSDAARTWERGEDYLPSIDLEPVGDLAIQYYEAKRAIKAAEELCKNIEPKIMTHMANHELAHLKDEYGDTILELKWPTRRLKEQPAKTTPAKPARIERQKTLSIPAKWINQ
tara:strand:- start:212 stop:1189 length:978 start_codon:yes stop_codon:yes gene_type:complete